MLIAEERAKPTKFGGLVFLAIALRFLNLLLGRHLRNRAEISLSRPVAVVAELGVCLLVTVLFGGLLSIDFVLFLCSG